MPRLPSMIAALAALALLFTACPDEPGPTPVDAGPCGGLEGACEELDAQRCNAETGVRETCLQGDEACPVWTEDPCGSHQDCDDSGEAIECVCVHECEESACHNNLLESCITDMEGCRFVIDTVCSPSQTCQLEPEADCVCNDGCVLGDEQCVDEMVQECAEDSFGCPRWQDTEALACPEHQGCAVEAGVAVCACLDPCALGDAGCDGGQLQSCAEDAASCLYWQLDEDCAAASALCDDVAVPPVCDHEALVMTAVGTPTWEIGELHQVSERITGDEDLPRLLAELTPDHNPWVAHDPPYDSEIASGMTASGQVDLFNFTAYDFSTTDANIYLLTIVPSAGAPTGETPDFASGAIIPTARFPLTVTGELFRDEVSYMGGPYGYELGLDAAYPPEATVTDGASHLHDFMGTLGNAELPFEGSYRWEFQYLDASGAGWDVQLKFRVQ